MVGRVEFHLPQVGLYETVVLDVRRGQHGEATVRYRDVAVIDDRTITVAAEGVGTVS